MATQNSGRASAKALLLHYPNLNHQELDSLADLIRDLSKFDLASVRADRRLSEQLAALCRVQGPGASMPLPQLVWLLALPLVLGLGVLWSLLE